MPFEYDDYRNRVTLADGDWRRELSVRGWTSTEPIERAVLKLPRQVREVAEAFLDAGAELLTTPTSAACSLVRAEDPRLSSVTDDELARINRDAARLCKDAAAEHPLKNRRVIGTIGPTARLLMLNEIKPKEMENAYRTQCASLADGGADAILCRGFTEMEALRAAAFAAMETGLPVLASLAFTVTGDQAETAVGATAPQACEILRAAGVGIVGCEGDEDASILAAGVEAIRSLWDDPIWITVSASRPLLQEGRVEYEETAKELIDRAERLTRKGACILAGGRGIRASVIRSWVKALQETPRKKRSSDGSGTR